MISFFDLSTHQHLYLSRLKKFFVSFVLLGLSLLTFEAQAQCADIDIVDLRGVAGFPQLDDLSVCGDADTLSFIVFTGDPGIVRGFSLELTLPEGIEYAGWEFAKHGGTNISNSEPSVTCPEFVISGFEGDSLIIANIGVRSNCDVDVNELLNINFEYDFTFIDTSNVVYQCAGNYTPLVEYNSSVNVPVLNILTPFTPAEAVIQSVGEEYCQTVRVSQDGLNTYLDSFTFSLEGLDLSGDLMLSSIAANGIPVTDYSYDSLTMNTIMTIDGTHFGGNALPNPADNRMNTNEITSIEMCFRVDNCPSVSDFPYKYSAQYGCDDQVCQLTSKTTFLRIRPTGSLSPVATAELNTEGVQICGAPGTVTIALKNPNVNNDQNAYTDLSIGFQTCDRPNLDVTGVTVNGVDLPSDMYEWVGDDINIDFTTNVNASLGLSDHDMDGYYDDLIGGDSINAVVEIAITCGIGDECVLIQCDAVQFYVEAKTNCGNTFKDFPAPEDFNLLYGPESVNNPTEAEFGTTGIFGYDFGTYSNDGAPLAGTGPSSQVVEFCYTTVKENIQDCPTGADNKLEVVFTGHQRFIQDISFVPGSAMISDDGGVTYAPAAGTPTLDSIDLTTAILTINDGSLNSSVCYRYEIEMDSCICSPVGYFIGSQRVVSTCLLYTSDAADE